MQYREWIKFLLCHVIAAMVAALFFLVVSSILGVLENRLAGIDSSYDDIHKVSYWINYIPLTLVVVIWITVLVYPFSLFVFGLPERSRKLLSMPLYMFFGTLFAAFWIVVFQGNFFLSGFCCDVWDFVFPITLLFAGMAAGLTFAVMRKFVLKPGWL